MERANLPTFDDALLYWLHIQPSEIDQLVEEGYMRWTDLAYRVYRARTEEQA
ncbi:hypothetical protein D3C84_160750 [compost metagenome]